VSSLSILFKDLLNGSSKFQGFSSKRLIDFPFTMFPFGNASMHPESPELTTPRVLAPKVHLVLGPQFKSSL
jgi:hypothetical protein